MLSDDGSDDADDNDTDVAYALLGSGGIVTLGDDTRGEAGMAETGAQHPPLKTK